MTNVMQDDVEATTKGVQSFTIKKVVKVKSRQNILNSEDSENQPDFVTTITTEGSIQSLVQKVETGPLVIPLASQRTFLKRQQTSTTITTPALSADEADLDRKAREEILASANGVEKEKEEMTIEAIPLLKQNMVPGAAEIIDEKERLLHDISLRPDEATNADYLNVPIEHFGEALIRGMGWTPGKPIGLNSKVVIKPIEFVPRHHRGGLGSEILDVPEEFQSKRHKKKPKLEDEKEKKRMRMPTGPDGRTRHIRNIDEEMIEIAPTKLKKGVLVLVSRGRHSGLEGRIESVSGEDCSVRLTRSQEIVQLDPHDVDIVDEPQLNYDKKYGLMTSADLRKYTNSRTRDDDESSSSAITEKSEKKRQSPEHSDKQDSISSKRSKSRDDLTKDKIKSEKPNKSIKDITSSRNWLAPHIRVRVVSKAVQKGCVYLKKGVIVDIPSPGVAVIQMDDLGLLEVAERDLETALPKGDKGSIMMLRGEHKGRTAKLLQRDTDKNQALVQLDESYEHVMCSLDDIAEYVRQ